ncbi:hypothetical protein P43SY_003838 [Pythium insidiosum]|uniref:Carboxypeptidase n=1 Tax=Pythium insidiosum TaxID=114742 RepID=A0AAD5LAQ7_PYTIN|nr:hypothetical protein P43SY_003838 [Pythium insidiosum]
MANERTPLNAPERAGAVVRGWRRNKLFAIVGAIALTALAVATYSSTGSRSRAHDDKPQGKAVVAARADGTTEELFCGLTGHDAGYIKLPNKKDDHYFYWYFESRSQPNKDPLVLWLTGGPGCSSLMAMLTENGPCHVQPDLTTQLNPYSWTNEANVVWLDQPTNVGLSYGAKGDEDSTEDDVGENIYYFLQGFLEKHPELQGRDFYVTGESYGGHYVPAAAHFLWQKTKNGTNDVPIQLKGIAIGNGMTDPPVQWPHTMDMVENAYNISMVNESTFEEMKKTAPKCGEMLKACQTDDSVCAEGYQFCAVTQLMPLMSAKRNPYDIRMYCDQEDATKCYNLDFVGKYLDSDSVREYLGVSGKPVGRWQECNMQVNIDFYMTNDPVKSFSSYVADMLNDGVRVLVYAGDADTMCNWSGNRAWTLALDWQGKTAFNAAPERTYVTEAGITAGVVRSTPLFSFFRIFNAGHMVPQDQPAVALEMINKFLKNKWQ